MTRTRAAFVAALLSAALIAALAGCAPVAAGAGVAEVAVAFPGTEDDAWGDGAAELRDALEHDGYRVEVRFAGDDVPTQARQLEELLDRSPAALVVAPIDGTALANRLERADMLGIPVVAFDRLVLDSDAVDYYATFDQLLAGRQQATALLQGLGILGPDGLPLPEPTEAPDEADASDAPAGPTAPFDIELLAGSVDSDAAVLRFRGALEVLQPYLDSGELAVPSGRTTFEQTTILRGDPVTAASRVSELLAAGVVLDGVLSPEDGMSRAVIGTIPDAEVGRVVVTGGGAELDSVRAILAGRQHSTVLEDPRELARAVAELVRQLLEGATPDTNADDTGNGLVPVPTLLVEPVAVTADDVADAIVDSDYWTRAQLEDD